MFRVTVSVFLVILVALAGINGARAEQYVIGLNKAYDNRESRVLIENLFITMYAPLGISPDMQFFPSRRGLKLANDFEIDAEGGRALSVAAQYENLHTVDVPMIDHAVFMFCLEPGLCKKRNGGPIAVIGGFQAARPYCTKYRLDCVFEANHKFMGKMLNRGAVDAIIGNKKLVTHHLCNSNFPTLYYKKERDLKIVSYHLVNTSHVDKLPALEASIKSMHQRGDFDEFIQFHNKTAENCSTEFVEITG